MILPPQLHTLKIDCFELFVKANEDELLPIVKRFALLIVSSWLLSLLFRSASKSRFRNLKKISKLVKVRMNCQNDLCLIYSFETQL